MKMTTALDIFGNLLKESETGADPPFGRWGERPA
jgi:hypothetical protein